MPVLRGVGARFSGLFGNVGINELIPIPTSTLKPTIQDFYQSLSEYSISQRRQVHNILRPALRQGVNWALIDYNPCDKVEGPRSKRRQQKNTIRAMSQEQAKLFLEAAEQDRWAVH